jgi:hypothetical protein
MTADQRPQRGVGLRLTTEMSCILNAAIPKQADVSGELDEHVA